MRDFIGYIAETIDSVVNRNENQDQANSAISDLQDFINNHKPQVPERPDLPGIPDFERQEVTSRTDDQMRELAESKLSGEKLAAKRAAETAAANRERDLNTQRDNAHSSADNKRESLADSFERASQHVNNDALRRGLARSSIAVNRQGALAEQNAIQNAAISASLARQIEQIDNDIAALAGQREQAIADFNVKHAARLTQKMHQLRGEQDRAKRDAIAFNNNVSEQERRAAIEQKERSAALHQRELDILERENTITGASSSRDSTFFNEMVRVLESMSPTEARNQVINNPIFRDNLSPQSFYRLFDRFTR